MDQDIYLIPKEDMVRDLPLRTHQDICVKLDLDMPFGNDCRALAAQIGMSPQQITSIWNGRGAARFLNPTEQALKWWGPEKDATVRRLVEILRDLKRDDVVDIIMKRYRQGTATVTGNVCQFKCSNFFYFIFIFYPIYKVHKMCASNEFICLSG